MSCSQIILPTKVYFGRGILEEAIEKEKDRFNTKIMIVTTGRSLIRLGYLQKLTDLLAKVTDNNIVIYDNISQNPKLSEIAEASDIGKTEKVRLIVGFGGGSAVDAAKAVAASVGMSESIYDIWSGKVVTDDRTLPIIAIPTTAGTGSELSKAAIVTDAINKKKGGIRGINMIPQVAIVDSIFTETIPLKTTMETGFDVLAHAMESYVSKASSLFTRTLSKEAMTTCGQMLPRLKKDLNDVEAREQMSYASMLMGANLLNASTALPHRLQYPVGAHSDSTHGAGLAAMYPAWIKYEYMVNRIQTSEMLNTVTGTKLVSGEEATAVITEFLNNLGIGYSLSDLSISEEIVQKLTAEVTGNLKNDPAADIDDIVSKIYKESL